MLESTSIRQMFGNLVVLRDLEFQNQAFRGLSELRPILGLPEGILPRKNEADYAKVVAHILTELVPHDVTGIIYVGDTYLSDGKAIQNLSSQIDCWIKGFLCKESLSAEPEDYLLGNIVLSNRWVNVSKVIREAIRSGVPIRQGMVGIFDLDQTTYAAKGRNDEALKRARLDAVHSLVKDIIGESVYEPDKTERLYREFDQDQYHVLTGDNQDFVVLLTLACTLGFYDTSDVRNMLRVYSRSIGSLVTDMRFRLDKNRAGNTFGKAWDFVQEVYYNLGAGDNTPCKSFRREEYKATAQRMYIRSDTVGGKLPFNSSEQVALTREIVDLIEFLRDRGATVLALSDRPVESTYPSKALETEGQSILDIEMFIDGPSIKDSLHSVN